MILIKCKLLFNIFIFNFWSGGGVILFLGKAQGERLRFQFNTHCKINTIKITKHFKNLKI